ncbi:hypothetical protein SBA4_360037 [Candidatus Sulfopaludibacter sp. SbA4]|nr:hypothetical protein SBA4_360037 [Candidatus Sulfopaludibacter sp. SbA4]
MPLAGHGLIVSDRQGKRQRGELVEERRQTGYSTPSEYVRESIRKDPKRRAKEGLDALLETDAMARLKARKKPAK